MAQAGYPESSSRPPQGLSAVAKPNGLAQVPQMSVKGAVPRPPSMYPANGPARPPGATSPATQNGGAPDPAGPQIAPAGNLLLPPTSSGPAALSPGPAAVTGPPPPHNTSPAPPAGPSMAVGRFGSGPMEVLNGSGMMTQNGPTANPAGLASASGLRSIPTTTVQSSNMPTMLPRPGMTQARPTMPPTTLATAASVAEVLPSRSGMPSAGHRIPPAGPGIPPANPGVPPAHPRAPPAHPGAPPAHQGAPPAGPLAPLTGAGTPLARPEMPVVEPGMPSARPGMPPARPGLPPAGPGMPPAGPGAPTRPGMLLSTGPGLPPGGPGIPLSGPGMPPSGAGMLPGGPGLPPNGAGRLPGGPIMAPGGSRMLPGGPGMPPSGAGMPPSGAGMLPSGAGMPPSGAGMPPSGAGMPPSGAGMPPSGAGMPPSGAGMPPSGAGMPPSGAGMAQGGPGIGGGGPGMAYPSGPGSMTSQRRTLDPDQMPSPITVMDDDQKARGGYFETREKGLCPPLVSTKFIARDFGNASPRFIRSTMYHVPATPDMMKQAGVPFGLVISPFAPTVEGEIEPPVSDFGPSGPVRCIRCKAYMCPFMQFIDGGRRFQCVFCKATTEVSQDYFQHLDHNGQRLDHYQRPELCLGAYEILATKDYCRDSLEPKAPGIIFAIDVSYPMMKEGIVQLICSNMKSLLKNLPRDMNCDKDRMRVGFVTYDSKLHFYNINEGLSQPQQMTVGDVQDMFVPLVEGFMVDVEQAETVIDALLEQIPAMFGDTRETETVLGPVIQAGKEAFKASQCAGKLVIFHHNLPVAEAPGKLKNRDDRKLLGTDKEKTVLMPQTKFYNELGQECVSVGCSVDLFLFNNAYIDIATLSQVSRLTGGQVYKYTYFQPEIDGERFLQDLQHNLSRQIAFDAIMRVRTSTGVRPVDFYGAFFMSNTTDTELAAINSDSAIACEIKHDDKLTEEDGVYIQAAVLYTSVGGQRRLRILNLALNTSTSMAEMYRNCELDTLVNFTAKQSISRLMETNPKSVKDHLISNCANILACYRKNCASPSSAGQLILPECMKLLPLYINCLIKSDAIAGAADVGCDDRAFLMSAVSSMDINASVVFFYPKLYPIHDLNTSETGLPDQIRCSIEKIRDDGVYLLENGIYLFMYIGLAAEPSWVHEVFGVSSASQIDIERTTLEPRDTPLSRRVRDVIGSIRGGRSRFMRLVFVRQREKLDMLFRRYLCEDRTGNESGNFSYVDFLCHMHKEIRQLLG